jgi:acyl-CoA thioester hydrolase
VRKFCRLTYRVPFSETDAMGIVHHSNHPRYMERGRVEFLRLLDLPYTEIMKQGLHFPLTDLKVSYKKPLAFDEVILIETAVSKITKLRMSFEYRIFTGCDPLPSEISAEPFPGIPAVLGETLHCCVNEKGRPVEMSKFIFDKLSALGAL